MEAYVDADRAVEEVYRSDWGRILACLIRLFNDFELAEEVAQEAFAAAVDSWRAAGVPKLLAPGLFKPLGTRASIDCEGERDSPKQCVPWPSPL